MKKIIIVLSVMIMCLCGCYHSQPIVTHTSTSIPQATSVPKTTYYEDDDDYYDEDEYYEDENEDANYVANKNTMKFHRSYCKSVDKMKDSNKVYYDSRDDVIDDGYEPCKRCSP